MPDVDLDTTVDQAATEPKVFQSGTERVEAHNILDLEKVRKSRGADSAVNSGNSGLNGIRCFKVNRPGSVL